MKTCKTQLDKEKDRWHMKVWGILSVYAVVQACRNYGNQNVNAIGKKTGILTPVLLTQSRRVSSPFQKLRPDTWDRSLGHLLYTSELGSNPRPQRPEYWVIKWRLYQKLCNSNKYCWQSEPTMVSILQLPQFYIVSAGCLLDTAVCMIATLVYKLPSSGCPTTHFRCLFKGR